MNVSTIQVADALGLVEKAKERAREQMGAAADSDRNLVKVANHAAGTFLLWAGGVVAVLCALIALALAIVVLKHAQFDLNKIPHGSLWDILGLWPIYVPLAFCLLALYVAYVGATDRDPELAGRFKAGASDLGAIADSVRHGGTPPAAP